MPVGPPLACRLTADTGRTQPHPARAERVPGARRYGLKALCPVVLRRRVPPRIPLLDDDLEVPERRRVDRLAGRDGEGADVMRAVEEDEAVDVAMDDDDRPGLDVGRVQHAERGNDRR